MEPNRVEFQKQCIFQSFCKRVLHNEACNAHEEIRRRRAKEVSFSDLALHEERQLYTLDKYFQDEEAEPSYQQAGKKITPKLLLEAIRTLPEEKRKAIMLYYFEGMTDVVNPSNLDRRSITLNAFFLFANLDHRSITLNKRP